VRVLVVGGGIGGLATAIALARAGHEPLAFERASALEAVGAGIALSPNAVAALERLGIADEVRRRGHAPRHAVVLNRRGQVLSELPYATRGWEMLGVHRADLQEALVAALPAGALRLGSACTGFERRDDRVRVELAGGGREEGDVLIGADGIHSVVRSGLFGDEALRYSGYAAWRAVSERLPAVSEDRFSESWGPGARFGLVPIGDGRLYWFVAEDAPDGSPAPDRPLEDLRRRLADWHDPIPAVLDATDESTLSRTFVYDRRPSKRWGEGRVTLVGDAAHPMTPNLGQGAAQALEDAVVLGRELSDGGDPDAALRRYERRRLRRANAIVKQSFQAGRLAQLSSPRTCAVRDVLMRALPDRLAAAQQARVFRADLD
jgi:2-polyprenyl-6-methoxyphenol hydroxylase-like FAD-dependent oxidoreductase